MAVGKNKKLKSGKKLGRKGAKDPFLRKEWYDVIAPNNFATRKVCKTCVNKTVGLKIASDALKGRVFETNLADLQKDEEFAYRKMKFRVDDVDGRRCLTDFHGMDLTNDRLKSLVRKWQSLIEAHVDVKTLDGYVVRMFCIAFTAKQENAVRHKGHPLTTYAQSARIHLIRKRMMEIMRREASVCSLHELVNKLMSELIAKDIKKSCIGIYPIDNVFIRKVKLLKSAKFDANKFAEIHAAAAGEDTGKAVEAPAEAEAEKPAEEAEKPAAEN
jgi:small subunit ribosomal protein S3Ae